VDLTVIWCFLLNTCELIHISVPKGGWWRRRRRRRGKNYAEKNEVPPFSCLGNLAPGIGASQNIHVYCPGFIIY
jgi:hypothetical protein